MTQGKSVPHLAAIVGWAGNKDHLAATSVADYHSETQVCAIRA